METRASGQPGETTCEPLVLRVVFYIIICFHWWMRQRLHDTLTVVDYTNPLHLDVVDRQTRPRRVWNRFVSYTRACGTSARVSEIDLSQPRHETAFCWRHNRPMTSQLTDPITLPNYPLELIGIYVHINAQNKESLTQRCHRSTNVQLCLIF